MVVGGINSGINHFSMAVSGKGLNLIGMATQNVGSWYNGTVGKALGQTGVGGFVNGFLTGAGETVSGMAQFSVYDTGKSLVTLATNGQARAQFAEGVGSWWHQLSSGNVFVAGQTTAVVASLFVGGESATVAKADEATSLLARGGNIISDFKVATTAGAKAFGKSLLEDSTKSLSTFFDLGGAVVSTGKSLWKATSDGVKEAKNVFSDTHGTLKISSKYADINDYTYNSMTNPGPLADLESRPISNFYGGRYNMEVLKENRVYYRGGSADNPMGQWFTTEPPKSTAQVRIDTAVKEQWINPRTGVLEGTSPIDCVYKIEIPKGTTIYEGPVGTQGGVYLGGLNSKQIYIDKPWQIDGVKVLDKLPIK